MQELSYDIRYIVSIFITACTKYRTKKIYLQLFVYRCIKTKKKSFLIEIGNERSKQEDFDINIKIYRERKRFVLVS